MRAPDKRELDEVDVNMLKTVVWGGEVAERCPVVAADFGTLADFAVACPAQSVLADPGPNVFEREPACRCPAT